MNDILTDSLLKCGVPATAVTDVAQKMESYISELVLYNSAYNLTNTSDHDELVTRHILDSLAAYTHMTRLAGAQDFLLADIGSGGGLPGIPLAAVFAAVLPSVHLELVERMEKRCAFLENCAAILGLKNVTVIQSEAERLCAEKYDMVTFRAFRPLDKKMTKTLLRITKNGGVLCAYKAKRASIREEMEGISALVPRYEVIPLQVPGMADAERNLVVIKKED